MSITHIIIALLTGSLIFQLTRKDPSTDAIYIGTNIILAAAVIVSEMQRLIP